MKLLPQNISGPFCIVIRPRKVTLFLSNDQDVECPGILAKADKRHCAWQIPFAGLDDTGE